MYIATYLSNKKQATSASLQNPILSFNSLHLVKATYSHSSACSISIMIYFTFASISFHFLHCRFKSNAANTDLATAGVSQTGGGSRAELCCDWSTALYLF